jgi:hypothetical protein
MTQLTQPEDVSRYFSVRYVGLAALVFLTLASILYCIGKVIFLTTDTIDFKYIWLAGHIWNLSLNPYSDEYRRVAEDLFGGGQGSVPAHWVYPPNWWPIASAFATYPYEIAGHMWRWLLGSLLLTGVVALLSNGRNLGATEPWRWAIFVICITASSATANAISLGQTAPICFAGVCCFVAAYARKSTPLMTAAIVLLALKPTLVLPICAFLLTDFFWSRSILAAGVITLSMAGPAFYAQGLAPTVLGFLNEIQMYNTVSVNFPAAQTGVRNLLYHAFGVSISASLLVVVAAVAGLAFGYLCRTSVLLIRDRAFHAFTVVALVATLVPLHTYDMIFVTPLVLLCAGWPPLSQALIFAVMFVCLRVNNVQQFLTRFGIGFDGEEFSAGTSIYSLVIFLAFGIAVARCFRGTSTLKTYAPAG